MNTKTKLAIAAVLFCGLAFPAFAGDQDSETLLATSGRIIAQPAAVPAHAYASTTRSARHHAPAHGSAHMSMIDFQAQGSR